MRENWGGREAEFSFDTIVKLAEWHVKGKYPRMIARLPRVGVVVSCGGWS